MYSKGDKIKVGFASEPDLSARLKGIKRGMHPAMMREKVRNGASSAINAAEKGIQERLQAMKKAITYMRRLLLKPTNFSRR